MGSSSRSSTSSAAAASSSSWSRAGPAWPASFHRRGLVDQYVLYLAPALLGGDDGLPLFAGPGAPTMADAWRGRISRPAPPRPGPSRSICWLQRSTVPYREDGMFTGIVEEMGTLVVGRSDRDGPRLVFAAATVIDGSQVGDSIAVNGCCLTVVDLGPGWWAADAVAETLRRTNLGDLRPGDPVNLERPVQLGSRLGGHLVQGHVDAVGTILAPAPDLEVRLDERLAAYLVEKGSVTVDGISLTVVGGDRRRSFRVAVIPHTLEVTTLGRKISRRPGQPGGRRDRQVRRAAAAGRRSLPPTRPSARPTIGED